MKINAIFERTYLTYAASMAVRATSNEPDRGNGCIYIEVLPDGKAVVAASDSINTVRVTVKADVIKDGKVGVPGRLFAETVKRLTSEEITLAQEGNQVLIGYTGGELKLPATPFREFNRPETVHAFTIAPQNFKNLFDITQSFVAKDYARPALRGVHMVIREKALYVTACDGVRAAQANAEIYSNLKDETELIVPVEGLKLILQTMSKDEALSISVSKSAFLFEQEGLEISIALLGGKYPVEVRRLLSDRYATEVTFGKEVMMRSLERAALLSSEPFVNFSVKEKSIEVTAEHDGAELSDVVAAKLNGKELEIAFNAKYLLEILKNLRGEEVTFNFNTPKMPMSVAEVDRQFILVPIRKAGGAQ